VAIAELNGDEAHGLLSKIGVRGYPTLQLYANGQMIKQFDGSRTVEGMMQFIKDNLPANTVAGRLQKEAAPKPATPNIPEETTPDNTSAPTSSTLQYIILLIIVGVIAFFVGKWSLRRGIIFASKQDDLV
jgi:thioredoxin-like negative regulator of GroEL